MMKPNVVDFLDVVVHDDQLTLVLEELVVTAESAVINKSLADMDIRLKTGIMVVASKDGGGRFNTNPSAETRFKEGDVLIVIGPEDKIEAFRKTNRFR